MTSKKPAAPTTSSDSRRKCRKRPVPGWLSNNKELDEMAKRRCLLVLSVLSGEKPVTQAIEEGQISRPLYYDLETRALRAMLQALTPQHAASQDGATTTPTQRIAELEAKVARLERDKRRAERLLLLTRHVVKAGPLTMGVGRKRAARKSSRAGSKPSVRSTKPTAQPSGAPSPTEAGGAEH
jgi:hypothetical protein